MAKIVKFDSIQDLYGYDVEEPRADEPFHITIITDHYSSASSFDGDEVLEEDVTFVEYVAGGKGGASIDVVGLIHEPLFWAYNLVIILGPGVAAGFTNAAGEDLYQLFKGGVKKFMAKRTSPGQVCITSDGGARLEIVVPDMVTEEEIKGLDQLIREKLKSMPPHGYSKMFFSPSRMELTRIYEH